jgi:hypothetical protein
MATVVIDYLIPAVRLRIGDYTPATYRYTDEWIVQALILAVKGSQRFWNSRYTITDKGVASRSTYYTFENAESVGVIEDKDEPIIILLACIYILEGSLENNTWNIGSWKDAEISVSNIEGGRLKDTNVKRLLDELYSYIKPPSKRLAWAIGYPLPGYHKNEYENKTEL